MNSYLTFSGDAPTLRRLTSLRRRFELGLMCPDCGNEAGIESNGRGEYRCPECDHRWGHDEQAGESYGQ